MTFCDSKHWIRILRAVPDGRVGFARVPDAPVALAAPLGMHLHIP